MKRITSRTLWIIVFVLLIFGGGTTKVHAGTPRINDLEWSPDGTRLVTVGYYGITVYDRDLNILAILDTQSYGYYTGYGVAWSPDSNYFVTTAPLLYNSQYEEETYIQIWNAETYEATTLVTESTNNAQFCDVLWLVHEEGNRLVISNCGGYGTIWIYDLRMPDQQVALLGIIDPQTETTMRHFYLFRAIASNPEGSQIALPSSIGESTSFANRDVFLTIIDVETQQIVEDIAVSDDYILSPIAWSTEGILLNGDNVISLFDPESGLETVQINLNTTEERSFVRNIQWSPTNAHFALILEGHLDVYNMETQEWGRLYENTGDSLYSGVDVFDWHPDGIHIATALYSSDETLLFDLSTLEENN